MKVVKYSTLKQKHVNVGQKNQSGQENNVLHAFYQNITILMHNYVKNVQQINISKEV